MADKIEKRKNAFKNKKLDSTERIRKQTEQLRKEKRSANVLAKRLKTDNTSTSQKEYSHDSIKEAITKAKNGDMNVRYEGLRMLRMILCSKTPHLSLIIEENIPVYLSSMLECPNENIRIEAAWCLTNIATGNTTETAAVLCAVPSMIEIINANNIHLGGHPRDSKQLQEQLCWCIGNIAGGCDEHRAVLIGNGAVDCIYLYLESSLNALTTTTMQQAQRMGVPAEPDPVVLSSIRTAAWTLSNLARGKTSGDEIIREGSSTAGKMAFLINLISGHMHGMQGSINVQTNQVIAKALLAVAEEIWWMIAFLTAKEDGAVEVCLRHGLVSRMGEAISLCSGDSATAIPLLRSIGNLASGPVSWLGAIMEDTRIIDALLRFSGIVLNHAVRKESFWVMSNILGGSAASRELLLFYQSSAAVPSIVLDRICMVFSCTDDYAIQQEAVLCFEQACLSTQLKSLLLTEPRYFSQLICFGGVFSRLLRIPGSCDVPIAVIRIINAITVAAAQHSVPAIMQSMPSQRSTWQMEIVDIWVATGITEALDDIQYGAGSGAKGHDGVSLGEAATALVAFLYELLEAHEEGRDEPCSATATVGSSEDPTAQFADSDNGVPISTQYSFGSMGSSPRGDVFNFSPSTNTVPLCNNSTTAAVTSSNTASSEGTGTGMRGMGRGSHLSKPSWMN